MISCRSYCCVRYGQWLYMVWFMDLSLHLHKHLLLLHVPVAYLTVSHFLLWEKLLCKELTPVSAETSTLGCCLGRAHTHTHTPWWNQERKSCGSGFWFCPRPPCLEAAAQRERRVKGLCLPSVRVTHSAPASHQCLSHAAESQGLAYFIIAQPQGF